ncbi:Protein CBG27445 [Caenorhabditis briggsae]|uniref:Protein CBG27445 n=1 Tax=Caenorhabditis briggsae TaxID=6238 RepID=B6IK22_CAEBR|nr:Protein CBG27445 [Caenorhabditis briggsae]CAS00252.1 Protein CBG27445 [Caenorhabditis briggsae]
MRKKRKRRTTLLN